MRSILPKVSVVVLNYNGSEYLSKTIPAILQQDYSNFEIIIANNGTDKEIIKKMPWYGSVRLVDCPELGCKNSACNYATSRANGEYILLMDNDLLLTNKGVISDVTAMAETTSQLGSISLAFMNEGEDFFRDYGGFFDYFFIKTRTKHSPCEALVVNKSEVGFSQGACMLIKKYTWQKLGGYDSYLRFGGDDNDLGIRLWLNGYKNYLYSDKLQLHIGLKERHDNKKYAQKFLLMHYAHLYTILKNYRSVNIPITMLGYSFFMFLKSVKQSFSRRDTGTFVAFLKGYFLFLSRIRRNLDNRKIVQLERTVHNDVFLKIKAPVFETQNNRMKSFFYVHEVLIKSLAWRALQIFSKQGFTFLIFILCGKLLSPYEFGIYNYTLALVSFLIIFGDFGISTATSKYVAEYSLTSKEKLKGIVFNSGLIILSITVVATVLVLLFGHYYLREKYVYVAWLLPTLFFAPMTSLYDGVYRGLKKFRQLSLITTYAGLFSVFSVYFLIQSYGIIGALISQNLFFIVLFLSLIFGYREFHIKWNWSVLKEVGSYSAVIGLGSLGHFMYSRADILFLGGYGFIQEINYFEIVNKILMLFLIPFSIFGQVIAPDITAIYLKRDYSKLRTKFVKYLKLSGFFSLVSVVCIFYLFRVLLPLFLPEYNNQVMTVLISMMTIVFFTQFLNGVLPFMAVATGHAKLSTAFLIIFGVVHVLLDYILINEFGFIGIAYSIIATKVVADILFICLYYKALLKLH